MLIQMNNSNFTLIKRHKTLNDTKNKTSTPVALCILYSCHLSADGSIDTIIKPITNKPTMAIPINQWNNLVINPYDDKVFFSIPPPNNYH